MPTDCPACGHSCPAPDAGYHKCPNRECDVIAFAPQDDTKADQ